MKLDLTEIHDSLFLNKAKSKLPNTEYDSTKILNDFFKRSSSNTIESSGFLDSNDASSDVHNGASTSTNPQNFEAINLYRWKLMSLLYSNIYKVGEIPPPTSIQTYKDFLLCGTKGGNILVFNESEFLILQLKLSNKINESIISIKVSKDGKVVAASTSSGKVILWNLANIEEILSEEITEIFEYQIMDLDIKKNYTFAVTDFDFIGGNNSLLVTYEILSDNLIFESYIYNITEKEEGKWFSKRKETFVDRKKVIFTSAPTNYYSTKVLDIKLTDKSLLFVAVVLENELKVISLASRDYISTEVHSDFEELGLIKLHEWHISDDNEKYILGTSMNNVLRLFYYSSKKDKLNYDRELNCTFDENINQVKFINSTLVLVILDFGAFSLFDTELCKTISSNINQLKSFQTPITYSEEYGILFVTKKGLLSGKLLSWQNIVLQELRLRGPGSSLNFFEKMCLDNSNTVLRKMVNLDDETLTNNTEIRNTFLSLVNSVVNKLKNSSFENDDYSIFLTIGKLDYFFNSNNLTVCCKLIDEEVIQNSEAAKKMLCMSISRIITDYGVEGSYFPPKAVNFVLEYSHFVENNLAVIERISKFDISCFDIDFVLRSFRLNHNFKACASIWASVLGDIYTPIEEMIHILSEKEKKSSIFGKIGEKEHSSITETLFWFLNLVFNTEELSLVENLESKRNKICSFLLSATTISIDESREVVYTQKDQSDEPMYPYMTYLLQLDSLMILQILDKFVSKSSDFSLKLLNTIVFLLEDMINTDNNLAKPIKLLGLFVTLHLEGNKSKQNRKNTFNLLYQALTINAELSIESEAALLKLFEIFGLEHMSEEQIVLLNDLEYKRCRLWIALNQENYLECIELSLDLSLPAVFNFVEIFYEQKIVNNENQAINSPLLDVNEYNGNTLGMAEYEIEEMIYNSFEKFFEIDNLKAVELIYFYDYDIKTIFNHIVSQKTKVGILRIIVDDSRFQVPNFLCGFYIKNVFEVYDDNVENVKRVESLIENVSLNSGNFAEIIAELKNQSLSNLVVKVYRLANKMDEALSETLKELENTLKRKEMASIQNLDDLISETFTTCRKGDEKVLWSKFIKFILKVYENCEFEDIKEMAMDTLSKICFSLTTEKFGSLKFSIVDVFVDVLETGEFLLSKSHSVSESLMHVSKILKIEMIFYKALLKLFNKESGELANGYNLSKLKGVLATYKECDVCGGFGKELLASKVRYFVCGHLIHDVCNTKKGFDLECGLCQG